MILPTGYFILQGKIRNTSNKCFQFKEQEGDIGRKIS